MNFRFLHATDSIFLFGIIFGLGLLYYLFKILKDKKWYKALIILRIVILINLFFLLLNPLLIVNSKKDKSLAQMCLISYIIYNILVIIYQFKANNQRESQWDKVKHSSFGILGMFLATIVCLLGLFY